VASNRKDRLRRANLPSVASSGGKNRRSRSTLIAINTDENAVGFQINGTISLNDSRDRERVVDIVRRAIERDIQAEFSAEARVRAVELDGNVVCWWGRRGGGGFGAGD